MPCATLEQTRLPNCWRIPPLIFKLTKVHGILNTVMRLTETYLRYVEYTMKLNIIELSSKLFMELYRTLWGPIICIELHNSKYVVLC